MDREERAVKQNPEGETGFQDNNTEDLFVFETGDPILSMKTDLLENLSSYFWDVAQ